MKGERYDDLEAVERTVGYVYPETLTEHLEYSRRCVDLAAAMGAPMVTTHMGIPPRFYRSQVIKSSSELFERLPITAKGQGSN